VADTANVPRVIEEVRAERVPLKSEPVYGANGLKTERELAVTVARDADLA